MRLTIRLASSGSKRSADSSFDAESLTRLLRLQKASESFQVALIAVSERMDSKVTLPESFKALGIETTDQLKALLDKESLEAAKIVKICETFKKELS